FARTILAIIRGDNRSASGSGRACTDPRILPHTRHGPAALPPTKTEGILRNLLTANPPGAIIGAAGGAYRARPKASSSLPGSSPAPTDAIETIVGGSTAAAATTPAPTQVAQTEQPVIGPDEHVLGKADAPVTIIEYASMTCPHCAHFNEEVM